MTNPFISIIVPCYNQARYLPEALQSVLEQTYTNWECIIVNDGSPDNTNEVAQEWLEKDDRFKYIQKENGGLSSARNAGLKVIKGDYIQFLDADDILDVNKFELSLLECEKAINSKSKVVISNFRMFTTDKNSSANPFCELKQEHFTFKELLFGWDYEFSIPIHCGFFQKSLLDGFKFPEELKAKEDWIMWLSIFKREPYVFFIDSTLVFYRIHEYSMTKDLKLMEANSLRVMKCIEEIVSEKYFIDYLCFVLEKKYSEVINLSLKISKIENSRGFKLLEKIKETSVIRFFLVILNNKNYKYNYNFDIWQCFKKKIIKVKDYEYKTRF